MVHPGHLAAYDEGVKVKLLRSIGFKNMFLSGDGIFLLRLSSQSAHELLVGVQAVMQGLMENRPFQLFLQGGVLTNLPRIRTKLLELLEKPT